MKTVTREVMDVLKLMRNDPELRERAEEVINMATVRSSLKDRDGDSGLQFPQTPSAQITSSSSPPSSVSALHQDGFNQPLSPPPVLPPLPPDVDLLSARLSTYASTPANLRARLPSAPRPLLRHIHTELEAHASTLKKTLSQERLKPLVLLTLVRGELGIPDDDATGLEDLVRYLPGLTTSCRVTQSESPAPAHLPTSIRLSLTTYLTQTAAPNLAIPGTLLQTLSLRHTLQTAISLRSYLNGWYVFTPDILTALISDFIESPTASVSRDIAKVVSLLSGSPEISKSISTFLLPLSTNAHIPLLLPLLSPLELPFTTAYNYLTDSTALTTDDVVITINLAFRLVNEYNLDAILSKVKLQSWVPSVSCTPEAGILGGPAHPLADAYLSTPPTAQTSKLVVSLHSFYNLRIIEVYNSSTAPFLSLHQMPDPASLVPISTDALVWSNLLQFNSSRPALISAMSSVDGPRASVYNLLNLRHQPVDDLKSFKAQILEETIENVSTGKRKKIDIKAGSSSTWSTTPSNTAAALKRQKQSAGLSPPPSFVKATTPTLTSAPPPSADDSDNSSVDVKDASFYTATAASSDSEGEEDDDDLML